MKVYGIIGGSEKSDIDKIQKQLVDAGKCIVSDLKPGSDRSLSGRLLHVAGEGRRLIDRGAQILVISEPFLHGSLQVISNNLEIPVFDIKTRHLIQPELPRHLTIGILGGLGPYATADIFAKILHDTTAVSDQEHLRIVIENNPQIPDRTAAIRGQGEDPSLAMLNGMRKLENAGADFIIVPCNTAHAFLARIQPYLNIPILSMIRETVSHIRKIYPELHRVGLLATSGTVASGVFGKVCDREGLELIVPEPADQEQLVMWAIYGPEGIKGGKREKPRELLLEAAEKLIKSGAGVVILGCTEIPLVIGNDDLAVPVVDPTAVLAASAVKHAVERQAPERLPAEN